MGRGRRSLGVARREEGLAAKRAWLEERRANGVRGVAVGGAGSPGSVLKCM